MAGIGIINRDSVFFTLESPDISLNEQDLSRSIENITITERSNAMPQGSITFDDPEHMLSRILRVGARFKLSWGYKDFGQTLESLLPKDLNLDEITGPLIRRGLEVYISSPSGGASQGGKITYNCNFTGLNFRGPDNAKEYTSGTKADVINQAFTEIGVSSINRSIDFYKGSEPVTELRSVRQDETTFLFLIRLAKEWRALFHMSYLPDGTIGAIFIDPDKTSSNLFAQWMFKSTGTSHMIGYKDAVSNVISYTWTNNQGESGVGDNVNLEIVNGEIVFRRFVVEDQSVTTYRLNQGKIQAIFSDDGMDLATKTKMMQEFVSKKSFEEVKHFFDPVDSSTAPQGYGYRIKAKMLGNPLFVPPSQIKINDGFPEQVGGTQSVWYLESVTHTINNAGYFMDVEIVDAFALSPVGLVIQ